MIGRLMRTLLRRVDRKGGGGGGGGGGREDDWYIFLVAFCVCVGCRQ